MRLARRQGDEQAVKPGRVQAHAKGENVGMKMEAEMNKDCTRMLGFARAELKLACTQGSDLKHSR
jgi:hypothetical protein